MSENNGMITKIWGPPAWVFLHTVVMGYPAKLDETLSDHVTRKNSMTMFFNHISNILPCKYCRESYNHFITEMPIDKHLSSRIELAKWLYDIHNKINAKLGVQLCNIPEFSEVYDKYENYRATCTITQQTTEKEKVIKSKQGCISPSDGVKKSCSIIIKDEDDNILHDCDDKPTVSHDILIEFYKGKSTIINKNGIKEILAMDIDMILSNHKCMYLMFPQLTIPQFMKIPVLDTEIIKIMKANKTIQKNLNKAIDKVLENIPHTTKPEHLNVISYMLETILLIHNDSKKALDVYSSLEKQYKTNTDFKLLIDGFTYSRLFDEWKYIVTI